MKKKLFILIFVMAAMLLALSAHAATLENVPEYAFSERQLTLTLTREAGSAENCAVSFAKTEYVVHFEAEDTVKELTIDLPALKKATVYNVTLGGKKAGSVTVLPVPHFSFTKGYACAKSGTEVKLLAGIDKVSMLGNSKIYFDLRDEDGNVWDSKMFSSSGSNRNFVFNIPEEKDGKTTFRVAVFLGDEQLSDWAPVYIKKDIQVLRRFDNPDEKTLVITVDCGAGDVKDAKKWIELLNQYNARATFFVAGKWAVSHPDAVKAIYDAGFEIGSHSYSHPDFTKLDTKAKIDKEIDEGLRVIRSIVGEDYEFRLFRYPYGNWTYTSNIILRDRGLELVQWVDSSGDSDVSASAQKIINRLMKMELQDGMIILFHNDSNALSRYNEVFDYYTSLGYKLVDVGYNLPDRPYTIDDDGVLRVIE